MTYQWRVLTDGPRDPAYNMAFDESLLLAMPRLSQPVLRFYGWTEPAASFGYFQHYADVEQLTPLRPLVRRPTGGGIVPHDADWTYSVALPAHHPWHGLKAVESYRRVHELVRAAFGSLGITAAMALNSSKLGPGQCFAGYEQFDVLWNGRKIAGAAQRRNRLGLLIQGSVQGTGTGARRESWEQAYCECLAGVEHATWARSEPDAGLSASAANLARVKYSLASYNQKR